MNLHQEKINLLRKYAPLMSDNFHFYIGEDVSIKLFTNASRYFARGADKNRVLGLLDTTVFGSAKNGYLFMDNCVYYLETLEKPQVLYYNRIASLEIDTTKRKDCDRSIIFHLTYGTTICWTSSFINKTPLYNFFKELLVLEHQHQVQNDTARTFVHRESTNYYVHTKKELENALQNNAEVIVFEGKFAKEMKPLFEAMRLSPKKIATIVGFLGAGGAAIVATIAAGTVAAPITGGISAPVSYAIATAEAAAFSAAEGIGLVVIASVLVLCATIGIPVITRLLKEYEYVDVDEVDYKVGPIKIHRVRHYK